MYHQTNINQFHYVIVLFFLKVWGNVSPEELNMKALILEELQGTDERLIPWVISEFGPYFASDSFHQVGDWLFLNCNYIIVIYKPLTH